MEDDDSACAYRMTFDVSNLDNDNCEPMGNWAKASTGSWLRYSTHVARCTHAPLRDPARLFPWEAGPYPTSTLSISGVAAGPESFIAADTTRTTVCPIASTRLRRRRCNL